MVKDTVELSEEAAEQLHKTREDAPAQETTIELTDEELIALCKARVCPACNEKVSADEQRLRALAEMDNFKKRLQREKEEHAKYAAEGVLAGLLPTLDNLGLAIDYGRKLEGCKDMLIGVDMTQKLLLDAVAQHGLVPVGTPGEPFNPEIHEAIGQEPCDCTPEGHVKQVMQKGYRLKERLLRPAKVLIASGKA
ncbi:nucleotide exchange factor GrpE [Desulfovibrio psychrotolerans]|uniref:Protein GrpE n=1 Tax=Desulfovibrio psychrotolerans TaxID=415242 RepID=A0A7J0BSB6_9BACT|nr:nucleotide exchange factor GrpE [Desulfovibrio psychrotolerans]GFM35914.1 protein GrpE [Desulfovibrio psychrotolerans]